MQNGKYVVLSVDDEQDVLDGLRMILEANDYVVVEAGSAEEGLKKYEESNPDLVLVDMMMETMDAGLNLAKTLKTRGSAPVYLLSSMAEGLTGQIGPTEIGLDGTFQKPVDPDALISCLKRALSDSR